MGVKGNYHLDGVHGGVAVNENRSNGELGNASEGFWYMNEPV